MTDLALITVADPIPATCGDLYLRTRVLGLGRARYFQRKARGDFRFLELRPQLPESNTRYSGHLIARWTRGELVAPSQGRQFFKSATGSRTGRPRKASANQAVAGTVI